MSRLRLLVMVGVLTMVVLAAFAMPAIANKDRMASNTPRLQRRASAVLQRGASAVLLAV